MGRPPLATLQTQQSLAVDCFSNFIIPRGTIAVEGGRWKLPGSVFDGVVTFPSPKNAISDLIGNDTCEGKRSKLLAQETLVVLIG